MNSWTLIKQKVLSKCPYPQYSVGYHNRLQDAIDVFLALHGANRLKDHDKATEAFNSDEEVRKCLLTRAGREAVK